VGDDGGDVVLDHRGKGVAVGDLSYPVGQLAVPEKRVASDEFSVLDGEVDNLVGVGEVEGTAARCGNVLVNCVLPVPILHLKQTEGDSRSTASHFMLFSQVTWPKVFLTMVVRGLLLR
jgi:hypothetical protein